jgi:phosphotransferase system  glucose/maltose/N-acetylglucosamine-specific IIC component
VSDEERTPDRAVEESRREVEERLAEVKASIGREVGMVPKAKYALLALVAAAAGVALAARRRRKKKRKR